MAHTCLASSSLLTHGPSLCPRGFPGKETGVGFHFLLQEIFPTQGSNLNPVRWQLGSLPLNHLGSYSVSSVVSDSVITWTAARQASLSITNSRSLLKVMSIASVLPSNHLILCRSLLLLPSIFPSTRVFSNELVLQVASGEGKGKPLQYSCLRTP